jgi:hypothetical protein
MRWSIVGSSAKRGRGARVPVVSRPSKSRDLLDDLKLKIQIRDKIGSGSRQQ